MKLSTIYDTASISFKTNIVPIVQQTTIVAVRHKRENVGQRVVFSSEDEGIRGRTLVLFAGQ
jgi:hypothetical protein